MPIFTREPEEITLQSLDDLVAELRHMVGEHGTQAKVAERLGISPAYLSDVMRRTKAPSDRLAEKLGYRREVWYRAFDAAEGNGKNSP